MKKILIVFGTRPEAIKLAPLISELNKEPQFKVIVCSTGQHKEMLQSVLGTFSIKLDVELNLMKKDQDLFDITSNTILKLNETLKKHQPDLLIVQGDTSTAYISGVAAFYSKIKIAHVEAGLRSYNKFSPFPEEFNRRSISLISDYNFCPTKLNAQNLLSEGIKKETVYITGNTVIDALLIAKDKLNNNALKDNFVKIFGENFFNKEFILITLHRREKFGKQFIETLDSLAEIAKQYPEFNFVYPVHLNPNVTAPVEKILKKNRSFYLIKPLDYLSFLYLMNKCKFIVTDSGGIQEEAYVFKKLVIVMRDVTERSEAVKAGYSFLVGNDKKKFSNIFSMIIKNLNSGVNYFKSKNPYGDGNASQKISDILKKNLLEN
jgi:UDP-N-acetylglucosamine 2-epimerase (non-hydrolysing)